MTKYRLSSISKADSDEKIGDFWDSHDFTELDTDAPDADFEVISTVPVQLELLNEIETQAAKHGVRVETLVNQCHSSAARNPRVLDRMSYGVIKSALRQDLQ